MWPSYKLVVRLISPILDKPKSVSLMCPMEVISRLLGRENVIAVHAGRAAKAKTHAQELFREGHFKCSLVRFEVSVHDAVVVQIFQSQDCLSKIHPGQLNGQSADVFQ